MPKQVDVSGAGQAVGRRPLKRRALAVTLAAIAAIAVGIVGAPAAQAAPDSEGSDFWLAFTGNFNGGAQKTLFITGRTATSGTVDIPGLGFSSPFNVNPGTVTSVDLPADSELDNAEGVEAKGIHVTAANEVSVYGLSRLQFTTDAYLGLPTDVLGTHNLVLGIGTGLGGTSEFGIAASQDGTTVTITPTVDGAGGRTAGTPYNISLNKGDAYQLRAAVAQTDLSGTVVESDKPVAVYGGHQCANIPDQNFTACDYIVEQMPPTDTWGRSFVTVPLKTRLNGDTFRFLASQDNTTVSVNGSPVATLNRGQVHQQIIDGQSEISSDKPILVGQYSNSSSFDGVTSDPFEMLIPPQEQFLSAYTVTTPASGFSGNFINLVAQTSDTGNVALDGGAVGSGAFSPIGSSGFSGAQVDVALGAHNLNSNQPFGAFQYGFASFDSYGYAGGQAFAPIARVASITVEPPTERIRVNTEGCVTATPRDANGTGVPDVRVDFEVTGVNTASGFQTADSSGNAQFCYTGANLGDDTIKASVGQISGTATKTWVLSLGTCKGKEVTIDGTDGNDTITGTDAADVISGNGGNDTISGLQGNDAICGRSGNDKVKGDEGNDQVLGGKKKDQVKGGDGNDFVRGQTGKDKLSGGDGNDKLIANKGADKLSANAGNDKLKASNGDDNLYGGPGNDKLDGGPGHNRCFPDGGKNTEKNCN